MHEKWRQMRVEVEGETNFDEGWKARGGKGKARKET